MTHEYSGESTYNQNVCVRFQKHINSIAVDRGGEHCVLGGKKSLYVIKLEDPNELAKTISNPSSKWDISIIEWNPHAAKSTLIASAANQEAHIWDSGEGRLVTTIPPHQRAVSDIGWSPSEPNVLVTSSLDSYINLWDVRDPNRALSMKRFSKYNGAVQAKWNRRNSAILASAHEGMIFIWDIRKEGQPIASITAHNTQIYGIDWSYLNTNEIISCSQDKMVKLWSIDNPRECKMVLQTGTPVLRAKYLPFGTGIVTVAERGNYILRLWSIKDPSTPPTVPIHAFVGHSDGIRSFDWRISRPKEDIQRLDAIQMLSWSKDQSLRFWCFDNSHLAACGIYASPQPSHRRGSVYFFGDLPPDSPTVPNRYPHLAFGGVNSPNFDARYAAISTGEKGPGTPTPGSGAGGAGGVGVGGMLAQHPVYMGDSLGEGYFGGMEDLLGAGHSDEGEEFRNSLAHLQHTKFGGDTEIRVENADAEKTEPRGNQEVELRSKDERNMDESSKSELVSGLTMNNLGRRTADDIRSLHAPEDQGLIPGDLEHEFLLLKKKKFAGINIVQANAAQRTMVIHIDDGDQQHDRKFQLKITFPSLYPHNASPSFVISDIDPSAIATPSLVRSQSKLLNASTSGSAFTSTSTTFSTTATSTSTSTSTLASTPPSSTIISPFTSNPAPTPATPTTSTSTKHYPGVTHASPLSPAATRANTRFLENLKRVAELRVSHNMPCIESCLVKLVAMLREDERMSQVTTQIKQRVHSSPNFTTEEIKDAQPVVSHTLVPPDANVRARSASLSLPAQPPSPTSLTVPDAPLPRASLSTPTLSTRSTSPTGVTGLPSSSTTSVSTSVSTVTADMSDPPFPLGSVNHDDTIPHIQVSNVAAYQSGDQGKKGSISPMHHETESQLPDFDSELASLADGKFESGVGSTLDPSTKVIRSKSTVELRSAVGNATVGATTDTLSVSPSVSPRPTTPSAVSPAADSASTSTLSNDSTATTNIRRSRSAGYNRLSGRYVEAVAMHVPSPRICGVAISPTGKLLYFQTIHCKSLVLPPGSSPQPASSPENPTSITSINNSESPVTEMPPEIVTDNASTSQSMLPAKHSSKSLRKGGRSRAELATDTIGMNAHKAQEGADVPSNVNTPSPDPTETTPATDAVAPEVKSEDSVNKLKDKLKYKIKGFMKDKLKYKIGKPKIKSDKPSRETPESFIGEFNLATFKIRHPGDKDAQDQASTKESNRDAPDDRSTNEGYCSEDTDGCSESEYTSDEYGSESEENTDDSHTTAHSTSTGPAGAADDEGEDEGDVAESEGGGATRAALIPITTSTATPTTASAINTTIQNILNKDPKLVVNGNLTLPFFGVFPRTYPELTTVLHGSKVANQFTTTDTVVLAQLKSLNSLRISAKMHMTDISHLMPINIQLGSSYRLLGNLLDVCDHNQAAARKLHRLDLVKVWRTLYVLCNPIVYNRPHNNPNFAGSGGSVSVGLFRDPWVALPIARNLVSSMFKHYEAIGDIQTLAMMSCVLLQSKLNLRTARSAVRHVSAEDENEISLLDPTKEPSAHAYRHAYGEMLNKWGLLVKRAELLKHTYSAHPRNHKNSPGAAQSYFPPPHRGLTFSVICSSCDQGLKDNFFCSSCKTFGFKCAICNLSVKGLSNFCILCGHGGHAHHMAMWFKRESYCPAGCKCECIFRDEAATTRSQKNPLTPTHEPNLSFPTYASERDINEASNESISEHSTVYGQDEDTHIHHDPLAHTNAQAEHGTHDMSSDEGFGISADADPAHDSPDLLDAPPTFDDPLPLQSHSFSSDLIPSRPLFPDILPSDSRPSVLNATDEFLSFLNVL